MLYIGMLWWNLAELQMLRLRLEEVPADIDYRFIIAQGTTSFRGHPRQITKPIQGPKIHWTIADTSKLKGHSERVSLRRNAIQRNATLPKLEQDDVFLFSDLDEVIHRQDWPTIMEQALHYGFIRLPMWHYYAKINLQAGDNWFRPFAIVGSYLNSLPPKQATVDALRRRSDGVHISTRGQHFSWLYSDNDPSFVQYKAHNNAHPSRNESNRQRSIRQGRGPKGQETTVVPVDHTYPIGILSNRSVWEPYIA